MAAAGGAERLCGWRGVARRCGERARTARAHVGGGSTGARRRCRKTAAARREGGVEAAVERRRREMSRAKQRRKEKPRPAQDTYMTGGTRDFL